MILDETVTAREMRAIEMNAEYLGVSKLQLMENAGRAVADTVKERLGKKKVAVVCGLGGNGGDGFVAARHLAGSGTPVEVVLSPSTRVTVAFESAPVAAALSQMCPLPSAMKSSVGTSTQEIAWVIFSCSVKAAGPRTAVSVKSTPAAISAYSAHSAPPCPITQTSVRPLAAIPATSPPASANTSLKRMVLVLIAARPSTRREAGTP